MGIARGLIAVAAGEVLLLEVVGADAERGVIQELVKCDAVEVVPVAAKPAQQPVARAVRSVALAAGERVPGVAHAGYRIAEGGEAGDRHGDQAGERYGGYTAAHIARGLGGEAAADLDRPPRGHQQSHGQGHREGEAHARMQRAQGIPALLDAVSDPQHRWGGGGEASGHRHEQGEGAHARRVEGKYQRASTLAQESQVA